MPPNGLGAFGTEIIYSFIIIVCSLMIYFGTKELYELSSYKGLKYFRLSFLFFAIAYFFRSFIKFLIVYFDIRRIIEISPRLFWSVTLFLFIYFSSMAIFYLLYSVMWKKWQGKSKRIYLFHILAITLAILNVFATTPLVYFASNILLFFFILIIVGVAYLNVKSKAHGHSLYVIYLLLFIFWILNILDILVPNFFGSLQLLIYLASSGIFLTILYRVIKKTGT